ncbi:MAG: lipopolysaccharide biosynthesis protein [Vicinamibacteria bacterium]
MLLAQLKTLFRHSAIYGAADVFGTLINFLLLPILTRHLTSSDYGTLGILLLLGVTAKILFRMGLDAGFFRIYYEQQNERDRKVFTTTILTTASAIGIGLFALSAFLAEPLSRLLLGSDQSQLVVLVTADTLLMGFAFVPMNLFRIEERAAYFTTATVFRNSLNAGLKVLLVIRGWGVLGVLWSDVISSALFVLALLPTLSRNLGIGYSTRMLKEALGFGLPKVPHGLAYQALNLADRKILDHFTTRAEVGLYHVGYMFGTGIKFFLSAFELAWSPFVYSLLTQPDAARTLARLVTYVAAVFVGAGVLIAVLGRELLVLMTADAFHAAYLVIPVIVLAYLIQGVFTLTSIGIGISKKAYYYPVLTFAAAFVNITMNFAFIPRFGMMGAAWATVGGYAVMAALGYHFANRHYPIPFEWKRLGVIALAGGIVFAVSRVAGEPSWSTVFIKLGALALYPVALLTFGFFRESEIERLRTLIALMRMTGRARTPSDEAPPQTPGPP